MSALSHVEHCMGTVFSFDVRDPGVEPSALAAAVERLHQIDRMFSTYRDDSDVNRLDRGECGLSDAAPDLAFVLGECSRWQERTAGWFSAHATGRLDPSGYVKGWAIEQASDLLVAAGSRNHCVNGGGDVLCVGDHGAANGGGPWQIGIADPRDPQRLLSTVAGRGSLAVATSGGAERGAHIIDPWTGTPAGGSLLSLTVTGPSIVACDVYATAGFAMGDSAARAFFAELGDVRAFALRADATTWSTFAPAAPTPASADAGRVGPSGGRRSITLR